MENEYWLRRWKQGETGWHQKEVEPAVISFFSKLKSRVVFVPLCGMSLDLVWLSSHGHQVIGVELSELACETFFSQNQIAVQKSVEGLFKVYRSQNITILNGDVFHLAPEHLKQMNSVYDRAALIALPQRDRLLYSQHLRKLIKACILPGQLEFLQVVLQRTPTDDLGPPYSVVYEEVKSLYEKDFKIELISREAIDMGTNHSSQTEECVYRLSDAP